LPSRRSAAFFSSQFLSDEIGTIWTSPKKSPG
jgi:hypothetical protein